MRNSYYICPTNISDSLVAIDFSASLIVLLVWFSGAPCNSMVCIVYCNIFNSVLCMPVHMYEMLSVCEAHVHRIWIMPASQPKYICALFGAISTEPHWYIYIYKILFRLYGSLMEWGWWMDNTGIIWQQWTLATAFIDHAKYLFRFCFCFCMLGYSIRLLINMYCKNVYSALCKWTENWLSATMG